MNRLIVMAQDLLRNFTQNPARSMIEPYMALLGDFFYGFLIMGVAAIVYTHTEGNTRLTTLSIWLLSSMALASIIIHQGLLLILGMIASVIVGAIVYKGFFAKEEY